jgi:hypothetical protein
VTRYGRLPGTALPVVAVDDRAGADRGYR